MVSHLGEVQQESEVLVEVLTVGTLAVVNLAVKTRSSQRDRLGAKLGVYYSYH